MYAIFWVSSAGQQPVLCDVEDGVCYSAHADRAAAQAEADSLNMTAKDSGWSSRYHVDTLLEGVRPAA